MIITIEVHNKHQSPISNRPTSPAPILEDVLIHTLNRGIGFLRAIANRYGMIFTQLQPMLRSAIRATKASRLNDVPLMTIVDGLTFFPRSRNKIKQRIGLFDPLWLAWVFLFGLSTCFVRRDPHPTLSHQLPSPIADDLPYLPTLRVDLEIACA